MFRPRAIDADSRHHENDAGHRPTTRQLIGVAVIDDDMPGHRAGPAYAFWSAHL
jgi:hypothetical protein